MATTYSCSDCGHLAHRWFGRCPSCGAWSTAEDPATRTSAEVRSLEIPARATPRFPSGLDEVDRVLGGGIVPGAVMLLAGEPGIGKSTLVLQLLDRLHASGRTSLLVTGEESLDQVGLRAARLAIDRGRCRVLASTSSTDVLQASESERPDVLVLDSIQTLADPAIEQSAGSPTQVRACAAALVRLAKASGTAVILVGHVTKEGSVAGPKTLEHIVDVVLTIEGERMGAVRLLRAAKNRFGSCDETGVFVMGERGLDAVPDPSAMLLADRCPGIAGSVVLPGLEGRRPLLIEMQALVPATSTPQPRRVSSGIDPKRLALLLGVLEGRTGISVADRDVFVAAAGGLQVREPAADLAILLALYSAVRGTRIPEGVVAFGEVGLGGEIRRVPGTERRLREAARLGFERAIVPRLEASESATIEVVQVARLDHAFAHLGSEADIGGAPSEAEQEARMLSLDDRRASTIPTSSARSALQG